MVTDCKEVKKFVMRSLRGKLSELLTAVSMEEDILDNILGYMNPLDEDANMKWKFAETTEKEKATLISIYRYLSDFNMEIKRNLTLGRRILVRPSPLLRRTLLLLGDELQKILAEMNDGEDNIAVGELEDEGGQEVRTEEGEEQ